MKASLIYLASASPRRHEILVQIGVEHEVLDVPAPAGEDEPRLLGEAPADYVLRTAREKAIRARQWLVEHPSRAASGLDATRAILSADTTVVLGDDILGKPTGPDDARRMLARLSGVTHTVHTAVVLSRGSQLVDDVSVTQVRFKRLSQTEIEAYCVTDEPMGKAGAYGIQGKAAVFIEHIAGSYTGVMGLPAFETWRLLQSCQAES